MKRKVFSAAIVAMGCLMTAMQWSCSSDNDTVVVNPSINTQQTTNDVKLSVGKGNGDYSTAKKTKVTVMVYGVGGKNLDGSIIEDLASGLSTMTENKELSKDCNVVVQYKFSQADTLKKNWLKASTLYSVADELGGKVFRCRLDSNYYNKYKNNWNYSTVAQLNGLFENAKVLGGADYAMNSSENLNDFINYAVKIAPAERYVLLLEDHGGGYNFEPYIETSTRAMLQDDNIKGAQLSVLQIANAIEQSNLPNQKVDVIDLDMCLENNLEELCELDECADYAVASSHTSIGWNNQLAAMCYYLSYYDIEQALDFYGAAKNAAFEDARVSVGVEGDKNYPHDVCVTRLDLLKDVCEPIGKFAEFLINEQKEDSNYLAKNVLDKCYRFYYAEPFFDMTDMMNLAYNAYKNDEDSAVIASIWTDYKIAAAFAILGCWNNSNTWGAYSDALKTSDDLGYDGSWSVVLGTKGQLSDLCPEGVTLDDSYGMLKFRKYTTTANNTSWYTWLLSNTHEPKNNPKAYNSPKEYQGYLGY